MASGTYSDTLTRTGLQPSLWTQFLGAFNDNLFKIIVSLQVVRGNAGATAGRDLALVGAVFVVPFLLFSLLGTSCRSFPAAALHLAVVPIQRSSRRNVRAPNKTMTSCRSAPRNQKYDKHATARRNVRWR